MQPIFFTTQEEFREWLQKNHDKEPELLVGFHKVGSGTPSMTWSESVDQALCFGWIDGVRKRLDDQSYTIRFSPRRPNSIWSAVNIRKVDALLERRLMTRAGVAVFEKRHEKKSAIYSYEKEAEKLRKDFEKQFRNNKAAWNFFRKQPDGYKRLSIHYVMSAKQEKTRISRLEKLILASKAGERL
jgi:uncharacterized protein YdeI (YjbR/CyaY-like superfamily)